MYEYRNKKTFENIKIGLVLILIAGAIYFLYSTFQIYEKWFLIN